MLYFVTLYLEQAMGGYMQKTVLYIIVVFVGVLISACNNDIFVDQDMGIYDPESITFNLECNGRDVTFLVPMKGIKDVRFGCDNPTLAVITYYDKQGGVVNSPAVEDVAKVNLCSPLFCINIYVEGNLVRVEALDNATQTNLNVWVSLEYYEGLSKTYDFIISPGQQLEIYDFGYFDNNLTNGECVELGIPYTFTNNSDRTQQMVIYPYRETPSVIRLDIDEYDGWAYGVSGLISIPFYSDGKWTWSTTDTAVVTIGDVTRFYSPDIDLDEAYTIDVAPNSKVTTITKVTYATLEANFFAFLKQPGSGNTFQVEGRCRVMQPVNYNIEQQ